MRGYLLDTHTLLWSLDNDRRLSARHRQIIESEPNVYVSVATLWEIAIKRSLNKLEVSPDINTVIHEAGYHQLGIERAHIDALLPMPLHHRDPFDRMLIAQARVENLSILTSDRHFASYDVALA
jgi:PIN domain nuclease of toxin-antitoxin system